MTRTRPSIYLSICMIGWAAVSAATAGVTNYAGLVACRFFLGFVEAVILPINPSKTDFVNLNMC
jgi:MFS family permease